MKRRKRKQKIETSLPTKANKILNGILVVLVLVVFRIWHVGVIQHEEKVEASKKPQRRMVIQRAERATIQDRFGVMLAKNKVQYNAAVSYSDIREVPRVVWKADEKGKKIKCLKRKQYITELAQMLAKELDLDGERLEDMIHSKASVFGNVPFVIKENISEKDYFRLKMLEKDWPGVRSELVAKRTYPLGAIGGEVVGYLGAISGNEYEAITREMRSLREIVNQWEEGELAGLPEGYVSFEEVENRLNELEGKAYTINDYVGKSGVEGTFDEELRGRRGKRVYLSDIRGNFLRELPGSEEPQGGNQLHVSISSELQEYAERLLTENEHASANLRIQSLRKQSAVPPLQPWIKGGAIIAMDPNTGEILALASYPRFDPNDFIHSGDAVDNKQKKYKVNRWLENEHYLANLWDLKQSFARERFEFSKGNFYEEAFELSWSQYLNLILPEKSPVRLVLEKRGKVEDALFVQTKIGELSAFFRVNSGAISLSAIIDTIYQEDGDIATGATITLQEKDFLAERYQLAREKIEKIKEELNPFFHSFSHNEDKLLLTDLYRLVIDPARVSPLLKDLLKNETIGNFREASARFVSVKEGIKSIVKDIHHRTDFKNWREASFKQYLAEKRKQEIKEKRKFGRPYIEYLDEVEQALFNRFWENHQWTLLSIFLSPSMNIVIPTHELTPYLESLEKIKRELIEDRSNCCEVTWSPHYLRLFKMLNGLKGQELMGYLFSLRSFEDLQRPLLGRYPGLRSLAGKQLEKHLAMAFYPIYGYGFSKSHAYRQAATIGSIFKLVPAYESLRQRYLKLKEKGESLRDLNPLVIIDDKHLSKGKSSGWNVGFTMDGRPIPRYYHGGLLPRSEHASIGRVDLVKALEVSSNPYFALLAGDILNDPEDLCQAAYLLGYGNKTGIDLPGEFGGRIPIDVAYNRTGLYAMAIGQHSLVGTPLQIAVMLSALANGGKILKPQIICRQKIEDKMVEVPKEIRREIFMPSSVRHVLLTGLKQAVMGERGTARSIRSHLPADMLQNLVGKTSTAEIIERLSLGGSGGSVKCKLAWFGTISFNSYPLYQFAHPDLVIVVYLRFGDFGNEAAPLAAKMVKKWKEIQTKHN